MENTNATTPRLVWRLIAIVFAPILIVTGDIVYLGLRYHVAGSHGTTPAFIIGIAAGGWFILGLPFHWIFRILCLVIYIPLTWALLIPYSLWFIIVAFHGMISSG